MLRFAPSPTGDMHIDILRVAIFNYLIAQQQNEQLLVRIEDGNKEQNITGKDTEIMMILEKFALKHDAVFHQSEHLNLHQTLALRLLQDEKAFVCKCTPKEDESDFPCSGACENLKPEDYAQLKKSAEKFVVRIKQPKEKIGFDDIIKGNIKTTPDEIGSFVILKTDASPTDDFAIAVDDMMSDISLVIREEEKLSTTAKQIHVKRLLGYENVTEYAHIPTITNNVSVKSLFEEGFIPDAILNYLLLLGNPDAPKEIFTLPDAIEWFDLSKISKSAVAFDKEKLRSINREHLKMIDDKKLSTLFGFADADIGKLAKVYLQECSTINELEAKIRPIFLPKDFSGEYGEKMKILEKIINQAPYFENYDTFKEHIINKSGLEEKDLLIPLQYLLTATGDGPELSEIYPYIKFYLLEVAS
jgi:glutamyl-tRNA synthetase